MDRVADRPIDGGFDHSFDLQPAANIPGSGASRPELAVAEMPTVDFHPAEVVKHQTAHWRGVQAKTVQLISHEPFEYHFQEQFHLLVAVEQGVRYDGETFIEGLPVSTMRNYSNRLMLVPAGRRFFGVQKPRLLTRSICLYIDPQTVLVDPDLRFAEAELQPRLLFEDAGIWATVRKLQAQIGSLDPSDHMYADVLGGLLAHELLRLQDRPTSTRADPGGLAPWQRKRVMEFIRERLAEDVTIDALADVARLSPFHFVRAFKQSFGDPPHRYLMARRIERAQALLADPGRSVTEIAMNVGYAGPSAFSAAFRRMTGCTPRDYRRSLE